MNRPKISVLMPTYNRSDWLADALQTALGQETSGRFEVELVVIDNDSPDDTRQTIEQIAAQSAVPIKYIHSTDRGDAQARNAGLPHCEGDWIAFMDDDELAEPTWLKELYEVALEHNADLVGGAVHLEMPRADIEKLSLDVRRSLRERSPATSPGGMRPCGPREYPGTDNLFISRKVLDRLVKFDVTCLSGTADYDFSVRAREAGFSCWFAPQAIVYHRTPENRLTQAFIDWESYRSGVMLAIYDKKYEGTFGLYKWLVMRVGQGVLVSLPKRLIGVVTGNAHQVADSRIRLTRLSGYLRGFLTLVVPQLFPMKALNQRIHFIKGREVGKTNPASTVRPAGSSTEPASDSSQLQEQGARV